MNRPIKFRAWTGVMMEYKIMSGYLGSFYCAGMDQNDAACLSPFNTIYHDNTPIMQFTGLLDKNGKEIWEGDILELSYARQFPIKITVDWDYKAFVKPQYEKASLGWAGCDLSKAIIIGNIYENPELIKN